MRKNRFIRCCRFIRIWGKCTTSTREYTCHAPSTLIPETLYCSITRTIIYCVWVWFLCHLFIIVQIINPKMPRGYIHNGVPIPSPPADVLALANNYTEPVYLVLFFDTKRTWYEYPLLLIKSNILRINYVIFIIIF